ncbi:hypothetical protein CSUI_003279 [Cystoisospora suis]|uniref:Uncharacterized protein n=1 Tax=Cystoisospora suis TaxID=483139 RepID=A0A2C6L635_9APIC|nr:hypothetical protein CSUI_003279 [Cystoisospora suis]
MPCLVATMEVCASPLRDQVSSTWKKKEKQSPHDSQQAPTQQRKRQGQPMEIIGTTEAQRRKTRRVKLAVQSPYQHHSLCTLLTPVQETRLLSQLRECVVEMRQRCLLGPSTSLKRVFALGVNDVTKALGEHQRFLLSAGRLRAQERTDSAGTDGDTVEGSSSLPTTVTSHGSFCERKNTEHLEMRPSVSSAISAFSAGSTAPRHADPSCTSSSLSSNEQSRSLCSSSCGSPSCRAVSSCTSSSSPVISSPPSASSTSSVLFSSQSSCAAAGSPTWQPIAEQTCRPLTAVVLDGHFGPEARDHPITPCEQVFAALPSEREEKPALVDSDGGKACMAEGKEAGGTATEISLSMKKNSGGVDGTSNIEDAVKGPSGVLQNGDTSAVEVAGSVSQKKIQEKEKLSASDDTDRVENASKEGHAVVKAVAIVSNGGAGARLVQHLPLMAALLGIPCVAFRQESLALSDVLGVPRVSAFAVICRVSGKPSTDLSVAAALSGDSDFSPLSNRFSPPVPTPYPPAVPRTAERAQVSAFLTLRQDQTRFLPSGPQMLPGGCSPEKGTCDQPVFSRSVAEFLASVSCIVRADREAKGHGDGTTVNDRGLFPFYVPRSSPPLLVAGTASPGQSSSTERQSNACGMGSDPVASAQIRKIVETLESGPNPGSVGSRWGGAEEGLLPACIGQIHCDPVEGVYKEGTRSWRRKKRKMRRQLLVRKAIEKRKKTKAEETVNEEERVQS